MLSDFLGGLLAVAPAGTTLWTYLGWVAFAAAVFFVILSARTNQSRKDMNDTIVALTGRLDANQDEIRGLRATNAAQAEQITDLRGSVRTLERVASPRALIMAGFTALGVDPSVLQEANKSNGK